MEGAARYDVVGLADEFVHALRAQLDYLQDMRNAERFQANFAGDQWVQIRACFRTSQHPESSRLNALAA
jgi:ubiquinone biosynthesis protein